MWEEFPYKEDNERIKFNISHVRALVSKAVTNLSSFHCVLVFTFKKMFRKDFFCS